MINIKKFNENAEFLIEIGDNMVFVLSDLEVDYRDECVKAKITFPITEALDGIKVRDIRGDITDTKTLREYLKQQTI